MKNRAFSLIELMVAVSVLAIGIIMIARSFLSASSAINNGEHRILALNLLGEKMSGIEEQALKGIDKLDDINENITINFKAFTVRSDISLIKIDEDSKENINSIVLSAQWLEGTKSYDEVVATYIDFGRKE
ncbi:MAG: type II secretion system protein [Candidatus Omnitrophota bacterium]|nr:type II secretion system protein [Candidatus Omnitrophota bacterium]